MKVDLIEQNPMKETSLHNYTCIQIKQSFKIYIVCMYMQKYTIFKVKRKENNIKYYILQIFSKLARYIYLL